jgi:K+-transporting ATPase ATPase A chain
MGYFTHKSQPVKSLRTVSPRSLKAETIGTLPSDTITFGILVLGTVLLIGALSFLPVLALGPIAEYLKTAAGV